MGPPVTVKLASRTVNTLQGTSSLHMLPNYVTAPTFQHRAAKRQEGSVPAYIPNTHDKSEDFKFLSGVHP